jgi:hypothetical protein
MSTSWVYLHSVHSLSYTDANSLKSCIHFISIALAYLASSKSKTGLIILRAGTSGAGISGSTNANMGTPSNLLYIHLISDIITHTVALAYLASSNSKTGLIILRAGTSGAGIFENNNANSIKTALYTRFTEASLSLGKHLATPPVVPTLPSGPHPDVQQPPQLLPRQLQGSHSALSQHIRVLLLPHTVLKLPPGPHLATPMGTPSCSTWNTPPDDQSSPQYLPWQSRGSCNVLLHPKNNFFLHFFSLKSCKKSKKVNLRIHCQIQNPTPRSRDNDETYNHQEKLTKIRIHELPSNSVFFWTSFKRKRFLTIYNEMKFILVYLVPLTATLGERPANCKENQNQSDYLFTYLKLARTPKNIHEADICLVSSKIMGSTAASLKEILSRPPNLVLDSQQLTSRLVDTLKGFTSRFHPKSSGLAEKLSKSTYSGFKSQHLNLGVRPCCLLTNSRTTDRKAPSQNHSCHKVWGISLKLRILEFTSVTDVTDVTNVPNVTNVTNTTNVKNFTNISNVPNITNVTHAFKRLIPILEPNSSNKNDR